MRLVSRSLAAWGLALIVLACALLLLKRAWRAALPTISLDEVLLKAQTGDLLLFRWRAVSPGHDLVSGFTHVAVVVREGGALRVLETHAAGDTRNMGYGNREGVSLYDMRARVRAYGGQVFWLPLTAPVTPEGLQRMRDNLRSYLDIPFYKEYTSYYKTHCLPRAVCPTCFRGHGKYREGMFCSEFAGLVLKDLAVLDAHAPTSCLTPESFTRLPVYGQATRIAC